MHNEREKTEYLEIYTSSGLATGRLFDRRDFSRLKSDEFMLCVHIYITDGQGRWLLQKRSASKSFLPGAWDVTAGAVDPGESGRQAAVRELQEELGLDIAGNELKFHCRLTKGQGLIELWSLERSIDLNDLVLQPGEVDDVSWMDKTRALELISLAEGGGEYLEAAATLMAQL